MQWQRSHCVKNVKQLRDVMGDLLEERLYEDLARDQAERATMSMLLPPQMLNTIVPNGASDYTEAFYADSGPPLHAAGVHATGAAIGRRTRTRRATRCTNTRCGPRRG